MTMQSQAWICPDCGDDHDQGECPDDMPTFRYEIEGAWFCWDCAENIGLSFIRDIRKADDFECEDCHRRYGN